MQTPILNVAINKNVVNKIEEDSELWENLTSKNQNVTMTLEEFAKHIDDGHPFCGQHKNRCSDRNFLKTNVLAVDIDDGMTLEQAFADPYVQAKAAMIYTTVSHQATKHKFRIVFVTKDEIMVASEMRAAYQGVIRRFGGDEACKDASRLFFGSRGSNPTLLQNTLPAADLAELITLGKDQRISDSVFTDKNFGNSAAIRSQVSLQKDQEVKLPKGRIVSLASLTSMMPIHCPIHHDKRPSAFVVTNKHGINGVHCRKCNSSFWPPSDKKKWPQYDFYAIEDFVLREYYEADPINIYDPDDEDAPEGLMVDIPANRSVQVFSQPYLPEIDILDGITFIRSPKGSGKSELLSKKVNAWRKEGKSVLLVGHRQTLLQGMAKRLGLTCYFYMENEKQKNRRPEDYYAICIDSIAKLLNPKIDQYDVILIDESEQVFSHLTSSTLLGKRRACYLKLFHYLRAAKSIVVADADLGPITINSLYYAVGGDAPYQFIFNQYKESRCAFNYYENENHLHTDMLNAIGAGGHHYVATNSKAKAEMLRESIYAKYGDEKKIMLVTAHTTSDPVVTKFINNIKVEILNFDVTIASPTLGTGIDITFDDCAQHIDNVFGFFVPRVNTHFDIDQQISRVRHPKAIRVWTSGDRFCFETDADVIRSEVLDNAVLDDVLINYKSDGTAVVDETYLSVYADFTSMVRASKNNLRKNLFELRRRNGWEIVQVGVDNQAASEGEKHIEDAKGMIEVRRMQEICRARKIERDEYQELHEKSKSGSRINQEQQSIMRRHEIESFYRQEIAEELVEMDDNGRYREKVRMMQLYLTPLERLVEQSKVERENLRMSPDRTYAPAKKLLLYQL